MTPEEKRAYHREYNQRPEVKAKQRERMRLYYHRPEVKAKQREYLRHCRDQAHKTKTLLQLLALTQVVK